MVLALSFWTLIKRQDLGTSISAGAWLPTLLSGSGGGRFPSLLLWGNPSVLDLDGLPSVESVVEDWTEDTASGDSSQEGKCSHVPLGSDSWKWESRENLSNGRNNRNTKYFSSRTNLKQCNDSFRRYCWKRLINRLQCFLNWYRIWKLIEYWFHKYIINHHNRKNLNRIVFPGENSLHNCNLQCPLRPVIQISTRSYLRSISYQSILNVFSMFEFYKLSTNLSLEKQRWVIEIKVIRMYKYSCV